ncbi:hypothetical protein [Spirosoma harenae]
MRKRVLPELNLQLHQKAQYIVLGLEAHRNDDLATSLERISEGIAKSRLSVEHQKPTVIHRTTPLKQVLDPDNVGSLVRN